MYHIVKYFPKASTNRHYRVPLSGCVQVGIAVPWGQMGPSHPSSPPMGLVKARTLPLHLCSPRGWHLAGGFMGCVCWMNEWSGMVFFLPSWPELTKPVLWAFFFSLLQVSSCLLPERTLYIPVCSCCTSKSQAQRLGGVGLGVGGWRAA